jgi:hypothetical protein
MDHDARFKMLLKAPVLLRGFFDAFLPEVARFMDFKIRDSRFEIGSSNLESRISNYGFDVIDLGRMDAECYLKMANPAALALASRMKFDATRRVSLTKEFFMRLAETSIDREDQVLVTGFFSAYQRLSRPEALQLEEEVSKIMPDMAREKVIQLTNPFIELGIFRGREEGRQEGRQEGRREGRQEGRQQGEVELVLKQLRHSLGTLTASQEKSVRMLKLPQIEALGEALLKFTSNSDLDRWLRTRAKPRNL